LKSKFPKLTQSTFGQFSDEGIIGLVVSLSFTFFSVEFQNSPSPIVL